MKFDDSTKVRIIVCSLLIAALLFILKIILIMIPIWLLLVVIIGISALSIRAKNIKEAIVFGALSGFATGLFLSVFLIAPLATFTVLSVLFSIVGVLLSYFLIGKTIEK